MKRNHSPKNSSDLNLIGLSEQEKAIKLKSGHDNKNFKRKLLANIEKINGWLEPLGIEIQMVLKKPKCEGKK